jgi:hypothetical protein
VHLAKRRFPPVGVRNVIGAIARLPECTREIPRCAALGQQNGLLDDIVRV